MSESKILVIVHNEGLEVNAQEISAQLELDDRYHVVYHDILEEIKDCTLPLAQAFVKINVGKYFLSHMKDILIREDMHRFMNTDEYTNYDGIVFLDLNKFTSDIESIKKYLEQCMVMNALGTFRFTYQDNLYETGMRKGVATKKFYAGLLVVPRGRVQEFSEFWDKGLIAAAQSVIYWDAFPRMSMQSLTRKFRRTDRTESTQQFMNAYAFDKWARVKGLPYGLVESETTYNPYGKHLDKMRNIMCMDLSSNVCEIDGKLVLIVGNKYIISGSTGQPHQAIAVGTPLHTDPEMVKKYGIEPTRKSEVKLEPKDTEYSKFYHKRGKELFSQCEYSAEELSTEIGDLFLYEIKKSLDAIGVGYFGNNDPLGGLL